MRQSLPISSAYRTTPLPLHAHGRVCNGIVRNDIMRNGAAPDAAAIDAALRGCYALSVFSILRQAWQHSATIRSPVLLALAFFVVVLLPVLFGIAHVFSNLMPPQWHPLYTPALTLLHGLASLPLLAPWVTGILLIGIDTARGIRTGFTRILQCYDRTVPLTLMALGMLTVVATGTLLFVLPGLYFLVAFWLALPLVVDAKLSPTRALVISLQAIHHRWFDVAALVLFTLLVLFVSMLAMGLPLIWMLPWLITASGVLYCEIFRTTASDRLIENDA
jgi:hypothetical protein